MLLFPSSLFRTRRIKRPYFLQNILAAQRIKPQCLKALYFQADILVLGKASAPSATKATSTPKMSLLSPGMGDTTWDAQKGPGGIKPPPHTPHPKLTPSSPVSPHCLRCHSGTEPCRSPRGCKRLFYSQWKKKQPKNHIEPILENSRGCFSRRSACAHRPATSRRRCEFLLAQLPPEQVNK